MLGSSEVIRASTSSTLITLEMKAVILNIEETRNFTKTYHAAYEWDPSDVEVKDHLVHTAHSKGVSWLNPFEIFWDDEIPLK